MYPFNASRYDESNKQYFIILYPLDDELMKFNGLDSYTPGILQRRSIGLSLPTGFPDGVN
jgi:hypothetical protein